MGWEQHASHETLQYYWLQNNFCPHFYQGWSNSSSLLGRALGYATALIDTGSHCPNRTWPSSQYFQSSQELFFHSRARAFILTQILTHLDIGLGFGITLLFPKASFTHNVSSHDILRRWCSHYPLLLTLLNMPLFTSLPNPHIWHPFLFIISHHLSYDSCS